MIINIEIKLITSGDKKVDGIVVRILASDVVISTSYGVSILGGNLFPEVVEAVHGFFQLLSQAVDQGGSGPIR